MGERNDESAHKAEFLRERPDRHRVVKKEKTIPATNGTVGQANSTSRQKEEGQQRVVIRRVDVRGRG